MQTLEYFTSQYEVTRGKSAGKKFTLHPSRLDWRLETEKSRPAAKVYDMLKDICLHYKPKKGR